MISIFYVSTKNTKIFYCMFDFGIRGISVAINWAMHDESFPAKWRVKISH